MQGNDSNLASGTIREDLLCTRWQLHGLPPDKAALSAWPHQLAHCGVRLFHSQAEAAEAHEAAPRWHMRGDYKCVSDSSVSVAVFDQGRAHLRTIAHMQMGLVRRFLHVSLRIIGAEFISLSNAKAGDQTMCTLRVGPIR